MGKQDHVLYRYSLWTGHLDFICRAVIHISYHLAICRTYTYNSVVRIVMSIIIIGPFEANADIVVLKTTISQRHHNEQADSV